MIIVTLKILSWFCYILLFQLLIISTPQCYATPLFRHVSFFRTPNVTPPHCSDMSHCSNTSKLWHPIVPTCSIVPIPQSYDAPLFRTPNVTATHCSGMSNCSNTSMLWCPHCSERPMLGHPIVPKSRCYDIPLFRHVSLFQYLNVRHPIVLIPHYYDAPLFRRVPLFQHSNVRTPYCWNNCKINEFIEHVLNVIENRLT
jgi:hypothetical protein